MNIVRNNYLMKLADEALNDGGVTIFRPDGGIPDSYNGQIAALGVSIAMNGLCPALASYYTDSDTRAVNRRPVLEIIARMIDADRETNEVFQQIVDARSLLRKAVSLSNHVEAVRILQQEVIDCSIALKQVVRTYNLV